MSYCKILEAPPIGEAMHSSGQCFCYLCTCGQHKCPYSNKHQKHAISAFHSIYNKDFKRKSLLNQDLSFPRPVIPEYKSPTATNYKTVSQFDFTLQTPEKTELANYVRKSNSGVFSFPGRTIYQNEFPNWGEHKFVHMGHFKQHYLENGLKMGKTTTYSQSFNGNGEGFKGKGEMGRVQSQVKVGLGKSPLNMSCEGKLVSTASAAFKPFTPSKFPKRVRSVMVGIVPLECSPKAYGSVYREEFVHKSPVPYFPKRNYRG